MSTTLPEKQNTFKKANKISASDKLFTHQHPRSSSEPLLEHMQPKSYTSFITELISAFNSLSETSTAPTSSPTLHTFFQGADHEAHVDGHKKKKVVKALQLANPDKVNEVISILKAMPDPTLDLVGTTKASSIKAATTKKRSSQDKIIAKNQAKQEQLDKELEEWDKVEKKKVWETLKSNDQTTGIVDPESCKGIMSPSWWFPSTEPSSPAPKLTTSTPNKDTRTKTPSTSALFGSSWMTTQSKSETICLSSKKMHSTKRPLSTGEQIALAAASLLTVAANSKPKDLSVEKNNKNNKSPESTVLHRYSSMPSIKATTIKALLPTTKASTDTAKKPLPEAPLTSRSSQSSLVGAISSITRQFLNLDGFSLANMIRVNTFWWGYEIYVPHNCMTTIEQVSNTSQIFFKILSSAISGVPGLSALVPIAKIISAWVSYQWTVIKAEDRGKGVVISAIWILPVALASRSWDNRVYDDDPPSVPPLRTKKSAKSKFSLIA
ncbi:hypothetical protein BGZ46_002743 [Entomortierella lignicola]|nr:hypothetical protein BGZ46_002743 [Entomortierella lignicola]